MKNLVVYYSRSGNTETVAQVISNMVDGDLKKVELQNKISFGWAGFTSSLGLNGKIKPINFDINDYDNIFIGCPVWAGKSSTPINTFLNNMNFTNKNIFIFITQADSKVPSAVYNSITKRIEAKGGKVIDTFFVQTNMKKPITAEQARKSVAEWIKKII